MLGYWKGRETLYYHFTRIFLLDSFNFSLEFFYSTALIFTSQSVDLFSANDNLDKGQGSRKTIILLERFGPLALDRYTCPAVPVHSYHVIYCLPQTVSWATVLNVNWRTRTATSTPLKPHKLQPCKNAIAASHKSTSSVPLV